MECLCLLQVLNAVARKITLVSISNQLPRPNAAALAHSATVADRIHVELAANAGWISFAEYMRLALYAPGLGYYQAGAQKFGTAGDFVTAPEISPFYSICLARQIAELLRHSEGDTLLELGAGSGVMALTILQELARLNCLPRRYYILEPSADLRGRQQRLLETAVPELVSRVEWLAALPDEAFTGVIVANEVLDALPVSLFTIDAGVPAELGVTATDDTFGFAARPAGAELAEFAADLGALPDGYRSEVCFAAGGLVNSLAAVLRRGAMLFIDYGLSQRELYTPERASGTLTCHYQHHVHDNPLVLPGIQDITAWVDFTRIAEAALRNDLRVAGYTTQAHFLLAAGITELLAAPATARQQAEWSAQVQKLMLPGQMGEAFKVMCLATEGIEAPSAFAGRDLRFGL
jgi:SAM-dependent MidA family methyltransferase